MGSAHNLPSHSRDALLQELAALQSGPDLEPVRIATLATTGHSEGEESCGCPETCQRQCGGQTENLEQCGPFARPSEEEEEAPRSPLSPKEMEYAGDGTPRSLETAGPGAWIAATSARLREICGQVICSAGFCRVGYDWTCPVWHWAMAARLASGD